MINKMYNILKINNKKVKINLNKNMINKIYNKIIRMFLLIINI